MAVCLLSSVGRGFGRTGPLFGGTKDTIVVERGREGRTLGAGRTSKKGGKTDLEWSSPRLCKRKQYGQDGMILHGKVIYHIESPV